MPNGTHPNFLFRKNFFYAGTVHLLPRFKDDKLNTWPNLPKIEIDKDELSDKLRPG